MLYAYGYLNHWKNKTKVNLVATVLYHSMVLLPIVRSSTYNGSLNLNTHQMFWTVQIWIMITSYHQNSCLVQPMVQGIFLKWVLIREEKLSCLLCISFFQERSVSQTESMAACIVRDKGCSCRQSLYTWAGQDNTVLTAPIFLNVLAKAYVTTRSLRLSQDCRLAVPTPRLRQSKLFACVVPRWWNDLPSATRTGASLSIFKKLLKTQLFREHLLS